MFAQSSSYSPSRHHASSQAYNLVGVETGIGGASPHQLVAMLFTGLLDAVARARGALRDGQIERKAHELSRAVRIVEEGLKGGLSPAGGALTEQLSSLYSYVSTRLMQANLRNDDAALAECVSLIEPLRDAWSTIRAQSDVPAVR